MSLRPNAHNRTSDAKRIERVLSVGGMARPKDLIPSSADKQPPAEQSFEERTSEISRMLQKDYKRYFTKMAWNVVSDLNTSPLCALAVALHASARGPNPVNRDALAGATLPTRGTACPLK